MFTFIADIICTTHFALVFFISFLPFIGVFFGIFKLKPFAHFEFFRSVHLMILAVVVFETILELTCPLTEIEDHFRTLAGGLPYQPDFVTHWLKELFHVQITARGFGLVCLVILGATACSYALIPPKRVLHLMKFILNAHILPPNYMEASKQKVFKIIFRK
jgi:hypothetical protein